MGADSCISCALYHSSDAAFHNKAVVADNMNGIFRSLVDLFFICADNDLVFRIADLLQYGDAFVSMAGGDDSQFHMLYMRDLCKKGIAIAACGADDTYS